MFFLKKLSSSLLFTQTNTNSANFTRGAQIIPSNVTKRSCLPALVVPVVPLNDAARPLRPCIANTFEALRAPVGVVCAECVQRVYAYAVESGMEWQESTATSMIDVVRVILHVASAVLLPSDVFVVCAAGCRAGVRTLLRCPCQSLHAGTLAFTVTHFVYGE